MIAVIDSSVAVKWFVAEDDAHLALGLRDLPLAAPDLILAECANIFWKKVRRGEYEAADAGLALRALERSPIAFEPCHGLTARALELAQALDHPAYDCFYLALAEKWNIPMVTADERLALARLRRPSTTAARLVSLAEWRKR